MVDDLLSAASSSGNEGIPPSTRRAAKTKSSLKSAEIFWRPVSPWWSKSRDVSDCYRSRAPLGLGGVFFFGWGHWMEERPAKDGSWLEMIVRPDRELCVFSVSVCSAMRHEVSDGSSPCWQFAQLFSPSPILSLPPLSLSLSQ